MVACALSIGGATAQTAAGNDTTAAESTQTAPPEKFATAKKKLDDFSKELTSRIKLHGYAQGGYTYTHKGSTDANTFDIKRVLFWADARITDRWSFLFMHDFSSVVQEYYTDFRITKDKWLTVRFGQFKNGLSYENKLSPTSMEAIDVYSEGATYLSGCGSDPLYGVQYGRDLGLALFGELPNGMLAYEFEVMNGQPQGRQQRQGLHRPTGVQTSEGTQHRSHWTDRLGTRREHFALQPCDSCGRRLHARPMDSGLRLQIKGLQRPRRIPRRT